MGTAYTPNGTTDMAYTVTKNGVTLLTESLCAAMRSRNAPISVHVLCPYGTQSDITLNAAKHYLDFEDNATRRRIVARIEKHVSRIEELPGGATTSGMITPQRGAQ